MKVLVIRPDRLGDVILSTPVISALREAYPDMWLSLMVSARVSPLLEEYEKIDELLEYEFFNVFRFFTYLRRRKFDAVIFLHSRFWLSFGAWLARVPKRVGVYSKPYSFLFFNKGLRQKRSEVQKHEAEYGLELLEQLGLSLKGKRFFPQINVGKESRDEAFSWLRERGVRSNETIVAVHPGMAGSALNWPEDYYVELVERLCREGLRVLITAGPNDYRILSRFQDLMEHWKKDEILYWLGTEPRSLSFLVGLYFHSSVVVAPSTGPLHLATAIGKPVVSFYPPILVQSVKRWGPFSPDENQVSVFTPEVRCGQVFECLGEDCKAYYCMKKIKVKEAIAAVGRHLGRELNGDKQSEQTSKSAY